MKSPLKSILFIDSQVDNYQSLITGISSKIQIVLLNSTTNGIDKITQTLQTANYQEVHVISHGAPGCLYLGNSQLSLDTLQQYQTSLQAWFKKDNSTPPRILLYGCNVAAGDAGTEFITQFKHLTGAEIAATANLTGNKLLGGDWQLEVTTADHFEVNLAIDEATKLNYSGVFGTFTVTVADDEDDGDYSEEDLSLREAIALANETEGADEIKFDSNLNNGTIELNSGQLSITDDLDIKGLGKDNFTIDAGGKSGIFAVSPPDSETKIAVTIEGLTLTGGNATEGGAIYNESNLTVIDSSITGNTAEAGGGIYSDGFNAETGDSESAGLTVINTEITNNSAESGAGGGIYAVGLYVFDIVDNTIGDNQAGSDGGGIYSALNGLDITGSTISGNFSGRDGGGITTIGPGAGVLITNSTLSNNDAANYGGGIFGFNSVNSIKNSTINGNSAEIDGGGIYDEYEVSSFLTLDSTIVAGNTISLDNSNLDGADIRADIINPDNSNNLIGNGDSTSEFINGVNGNLVGTTDNPINPQLGDLQDNGGNTFTQALLEDSPAIDASSNPQNLETDQRGEGFDRTVGNGTDIGAYEVQDGSGEIPTDLVVSTLEDEDDGDYSEGDLSLREAISLANQREGADEIQFASNLNNGTIELNSGQLSITDALDIQGLGADNLTIDAGGNSGIFAISPPNVDTEVAVTIDGLTLTGGNATEGGAIVNNGELTVSNTRITGNTADFGGGISTSSGGGNPDLNFGSLTVINTEITNNSAEYGGGIDAGSISVVDIINSTIGDNQAEANGGGIINFSDGLDIINSTISGNSAGGDGGGIFSAGFRTGTDVTNSTISDNSAANGGGIFATESSTSFNNSTISGNSAVNNGGGIVNIDALSNISNSTISSNSAISGGGIYNQDNGVIGNEDFVTLTSSIVAENTQGADLGGNRAYTSNGNNLIGNGDGAVGFIDGVNGDIVGTTDNPINPQLGELQDNGGNTFTQALLEDSPAIDAGSNPNNLETDQRGEGFDRTVGNGTDIGAYELQFTAEPGLYVAGTAGNDTLIGGAGDDTLEGSDGNDFIVAGAGSDLNNGGRGRDTVRGGLGNDTIFGDFGQDLLLGEGGDDDILGNEAADTLLGGSGNDTLRGGGNSDFLDGGDGDDLLFGDFAGDTLLGGAGNDTLYGASGKDFLEGGEGDDLLYGSQGFDVLSGNEGADIFVLESRRGTDSIVDFVDGSDRLGLSDGFIFDNLSFAQDGANTLIHDLTDNNKTLAVLFNVDATDINADDFTLV